MAKSWLPALRSRGVETKSMAGRVRSSSLAYSVAGSPYQQNWSTSRAVREGFQANPWIYRACSVIADTGTQRKIVMREGDPDDGDLIPMRNDPSRALYCLNRRANPWETSRMLRHRLYILMCLSSRGVPLEIARSRTGRISTITILDPDLVDPVPSKTNPIASFQIRNTTDVGAPMDWLPPFDPDTDPGEQPNQVLWVRNPHPTILTAGMSAMEAAGLSVDLDHYARVYNRNYMQGGGRPGGILGVRGQVTPETLVKLESEFNRDANPGATTAIQADAMFYQDLSTNPRDMLWGEVMDRMRSEASMTLGVPQSLMGDASGSTFDNADAEYAIFMEHRFAPFIGGIDDQIDVLSGADMDDAYIRHDTSDVWVLKRHRRADEDRMAADLDRGAITFNEYREFRGLGPIDAPWAKVCWIAPQKIAGYVSDPGDAASAAQAPMAGAAAAGQGPGMGLGDAGAGMGTADPLDTPGNTLALPAGPSGGADLRQLTAGGQGRSPGGGQDGNGFEMAHLSHDEIEAAGLGELEGKQSRARADRAPRPTWR